VRSVNDGRLLVAVAAALALVLSTPFVGQIRGAIQEALPGQYRNIVAGSVAAIVTVAGLIAVTRIREDRLWRYGLLAAALAGGVGYGYVTASGNAEVDAVERFHFIEYGVLALLFHRVWKDRGGAASLVFPALSGILVGTLDEAFQWFIPARVGELRDVLLNSAATVSGLAFAVALDVSRRAAGPARSTRRDLACGVAAAIAAVALFVHTVHLGYEVRDATGGVFFSRFSELGLREAAGDRSARWRTEPPVVLRRVSREDQYLAEGLWHVQRRNEAASAHDGWTAWQENQILETWFAPVLDFPSYVNPGGSRWAATDRAAIGAEVDHRPRGQAFVSTANPMPIYTWNRGGFLAVAFLVIGVVVLVGVTPASGRRPR